MAYPNGCISGCGVVFFALSFWLSRTYLRQRLLPTNGKWLAVVPHAANENWPLLRWRKRITFGNSLSPRGRGWAAVSSLRCGPHGALQRMEHEPVDGLSLAEAHLGFAGCALTSTPGGSSSRIAVGGVTLVVQDVLVGPRTAWASSLSRTKRPLTKIYCASRVARE